MDADKPKTSINLAQHNSTRRANGVAAFWNAEAAIEAKLGLDRWG